MTGFIFPIQSRRKLSAFTVKKIKTFELQKAIGNQFACSKCDQLFCADRVTRMSID